MSNNNTPNRSDRATRNLHLPKSHTSAITLQATTRDPLTPMLNRLLRGLRTSGSFVRDHRPISSSTVVVTVEIDAHTAGDTCAALIAAGLDLDRTAHTALATLCTQYRWHQLAHCPLPNLEIHLEIRSQGRPNLAHASPLAPSA